MTSTIPALTTAAAKDSDNMATADSISGKSPAFQFYPNDFISDRHVVVMSMAERGVYITLLCQSWQHPLPTDVDRLARLCGLPVTAFRKLWPAVRVCFIEHGGNLIQPRLERERQKQSDYKRDKSEAGKRGAGKRWQKDGTPMPLPSFTDSTTNGKRTEVPIANDSSSSASSSSSSDSSRVPSGTLARTRSRGLMEGSMPSQHGDCLVHGPVCFRPRFAAKYLPRFGGDQTAMVAWARAVCDEWDERVERGERVPEGDDFAFWAARYTEHHSRQTPSEGALQSNLRKSTEEFLKS